MKPKFFNLLGLLTFLLILGCQPSQDISRSLVEQQHSIFLPLVAKADKLLPITKPRFGVIVLHQTWNDFGHNYAGDMLKVPINIAWIVPYPSVPSNFSRYDVLIQNSDLRFINFVGAPEWMTGGQLVCKLPLMESVDLWIAVVLQAIALYGPDIISLWNEPDTAYTGAAYYFGCIGEDYASGVQYAEFYNYVYAKIKKQYPDLIILGGEIMNPYHPFYAGFIDTVTTYDGIAFHHYDWCDEPSRLDQTISMVQALATEPIYLTETSLICQENSLSAEQQQVDYYHLVNQKDELEWVLWHTLNDTDWLNSGMMDGERLKLVGQEYKGE